MSGTGSDNCNMSNPTHQSGASLVVALVMLVALMLLGLMAINLSDTQFKLAGNIQYQNNALNQAETALTRAHVWLTAGTNYKSTGFDTYDSGSTPELYPSISTVDPLAMTWSDGNSRKVDTAGAQRYIIQLLGRDKKLLGTAVTIGGRASVGCSKADLFRITTRGEGGRGAIRYVQEIYSVLSC